jgi:hypothetical protein
MLNMNYQINPTEAGKRMLNEFIQARTKPSVPPLLETPNQ